MKSSWVEEYIILREKHKENIEEGITEECKKGNIKNRFTLLTLALFCKNHLSSYASSWLKEMSLDRLTRRNQADALFIFAYEALKDVDVQERDEKFTELLLEYFIWKKDKGLLEESVDSDTGKVARNMIFPKVKTFGDLYSRIEHVSVVSKYGSMATIKTDKDAMAKLNSILEDKHTLSDYLDYLLYEDVTINDYNKKSTFYMQKMLYSIIKNGVDILCNHNLTMSEDEKKRYEETRDLILSSDSKNSNTYNRYLKYNGFYIKDRKSFGDWIFEHRNNLTPMMCIEELKKYEINYNGIFTALYLYIVGEKYGNIEKEIENLTKKEIESKMSISLDTYQKIFQGAAGIYVKRDVIRDLERYISGNKCVSRSLLVLFGLFANYNKQELNKALRKSGYRELSTKDGLDNAALEILKSNIGVDIEKIANTKEYINRVGAYDSKWNSEMAEGEFEREKYISCIKKVGQILEANLTEEDDYALTELFKGDYTKKTIEEIEERDMKKFRKMKRR